MTLLNGPVLFLAPAAILESLQSRLNPLQLSQLMLLPLDMQTQIPALPPGGLLISAGHTCLDDYLLSAQWAQAQQWQHVDLALTGEPQCAAQFGWMLAAGGTHQALSLAAPLLDALAPAGRNSWLHAGGPGAASFLALLQLILMKPLLESWKIIFPDGKPSPKADLLKLAQLQTEQWQDIVPLCTRYLILAQDRKHQAFHTQNCPFNLPAYAEPASSLAQFILSLTKAN
ncbi:hypothetical protein HA050_03460 [Iodobacter sp. HSC-16F04]|uniref:Uncharacterized protein n=1 Tax=Iodobacter violaceini TaxID=3044271 RepID=A0ABX0KSV6_9NEIS|nr:hypothetical protein [Iodobacter violacea]NHQ85167.1 hypothetical protein [Iodobacter violacea]